MAFRVTVPRYHARCDGRPGRVRYKPDQRMLLVIDVRDNSEYAEATVRVGRRD